MNIFVAKLSFDTDESALKAAFEEFGEVDSCKIIMDKFSGRSKGFGFVEMPNDDEANNAINDLKVVEDMAAEAAVVVVDTVAAADTAAVVEDIRIEFKYFYRINRKPLQICRGFLYGLA